MAEITARLSTALADRYRIERRLGEGGMATVYLAEDLKHKRKVAVKVLRPELAAVLGAERFVQEITTTASLQHPNILPLFDSGEADGFLYYVMPYIEGETLREKLNRETQLGIDEAVKIAIEVGEALDAAHQQGVIHRDIKPENVLVHKGRPMVADFGIALAVSAAAGGRMTETGLSLGTPHYMSPEQATAEKDITARSDVYSLGSVLYEMLAGSPPHLGGSAQQIIMKIVTEEAAPVTSMRKSVPPNVAAAVGKALEKLPADRFASAAEFAAALRNPAFESSAVGIATRRATAAPLKRRHLLTAALATTTLLAIAFGLLGWFRSPPEARIIRFEVSLPNLRYAAGKSLTLSPDGRRLVFGSTGPEARGAALWHRELDALEAVMLAGTDGATDPSFSPDGRSVAFATTNLGAAPGPIRIVSLDGGPPATIGTGFPPVDWGEDGYVYFLTGDSPGSDVDRVIVRVPAPTGGQLDTVFRAGSLAPLWIDALPSGRGMVFTLFARADASEINVVDFETGERSSVGPGVYARYAASGHLLIAQGDGSLTALPFDESTLRATGPALPMLEGLWVGPFGDAQFTVSENGTFLYVPGSSWGESIVSVDREGNEEVVDPDWTGVDFRYLALSPDGNRLAVSIFDGEWEDIWITPIDRAQRLKLTFGNGRNTRPVWYPDGQSLLFLSDQGGAGPTGFRAAPQATGPTEPALYRRRANGSGDAEVIRPADQSWASAVLSPDTSWMVVATRSDTDGAGDILGLRLDGDTGVTPLVATPFTESQPALSRDGNWLAYVSNASGRTEVYVVPFPNTGDGRWLVSGEGGQEPLWAHSGEELFYKSAGRLMVADVRTSPSFDVRSERPLFDITAHQSDVVHRRYDITRDDARFIMIRNVPFEREGRNPVLVVNFLEELNAQVNR
jgi:serine/threonine-protein kinase